MSGCLYVKFKTCDIVTAVNNVLKTVKILQNNLHLQDSKALILFCIVKTKDLKKR